jgi:hypothetical protein
MTSNTAHRGRDPLLQVLFFFVGADLVRDTPAKNSS